MTQALPSYYKRILLKLSGEILADTQSFGINPAKAMHLAHLLKTMQSSGLQIGLVLGGGNIFRGMQLAKLGFERTPADQIGMLATVMNGIVLEQALRQLGCKVKLLTALDCPKVAESYQWQKALDYLEQGYLLIFAGGTGNPFFTTDTGAALRASEIKADVFLKATKVDGVYNKDPLKHQDAIKYQKISYEQYINENLNVLDTTAVTMCRNQQIPILVFHMQLLDQVPMQEILQLKHPVSLINRQEGE